MVRTCVPARAPCIGRRHGLGAGSSRVPETACGRGDQYLGSDCRCLCQTNGRPPENGACPCVFGQTNCGGVCVDASSDHGNCGGCGFVCLGGQTCRAGSCILWIVTFGGPGNSTFFIDDELEIYVNGVLIYTFLYGTYDPISFEVNPGDQLRVVGTNTVANSPAILTPIELVRFPDGAVQVLESTTFNQVLPIQVFYDKTFTITF
jgi:hypothetical protein